MTDLYIMVLTPSSFSAVLIKELYLQKQNKQKKPRGFSLERYTFHQLS
jgi:hypothetical protein